jgi:hypothetical protein
VGAPASPAERIAARLASYLGPNTARTAVRSFADRALGQKPEAIGREDAPRLVEALRPMLRTLLGSAAADRVVAEILEELR